MRCASGVRRRFRFSSSGEFWQEYRSCRQRPCIGTEFVELGARRPAGNGLARQLEPVLDRIGLVAGVDGQPGIKGYDITSRTVFVAKGPSAQTRRLLPTSDLHRRVRYPSTAVNFGEAYVLHKYF